MKESLTELLRFGKYDRGLVREGDRYLRVSEGSVTEIEMALDHAEFMELMNRLRYGDFTEKERREALDELATAVSSTLKVDDWSLPEGEVQVDLVLGPAELSALPWELLKLDGEFAFISSAVKRIATRRVRHEFQEEPLDWRGVPRILFINASPTKNSEGEPLESTRSLATKHREELIGALRPWIEPLKGFEEAAPDSRKVLTNLESATLEKIRQACEDSVENGRNPFTHVHILAHGTRIGNEMDQHYGLALHAAEGTNAIAVSGDELAAALQPIRSTCMAVTLAVCDSGNQQRTWSPNRSLAHMLHVRGFPVVVASQLPLTFPGSTLLTRTFYRSVLSGTDVRMALHEARVALYKCDGEGRHDWASLVGYVRLPEGYRRILTSVALQSELASLQSSQAWSDHLVKHKIDRTEPYEHVLRHLSERIENLQRFVRGHSISSKDWLEAVGLQASSYKRLAEACNFRGNLPGANRQDWVGREREALEHSLEKYQEAHTANLSHHWSGVQALSLEVILRGRIENIHRWHAALDAARTDVEKGSAWGYGSIAELYLLASSADSPEEISKAREALSQLAETASSPTANPFIIDSTRRQLERYRCWWLKDADYFPGRMDLSGRAAELIEFL